MSFRNSISRRDFLRFAASLPAAWIAGPFIRSVVRKSQPDVPNVIMLVFDAWSARHLQFQGYPRVTMPNLEKFAQRATVFHNHYSSGTFTVPGTASLLTGMHPWKHRALNLANGGITSKEEGRNIFNLLSSTHSTLGFAQNKYADLHLFQMARDLDAHIPAGAFDLEQQYIYNTPLFQNDVPAAYAAFEENLVDVGDGKDASLFLGPLLWLWRLWEQEQNTLQVKGYPRGLPDSSQQFVLSDLVDGVIDLLRNIEKSTFAYFHFHPPHDPYRPTRKYVRFFNNDGWQPVEKPIHWLSRQKRAYDGLVRLNQNYDEYLLSWDAEVARIFEYLQSSGLLDQSYVLITTDHGEMFERGEFGHTCRMIYEPLVHVPLIILAPGRTDRKDVYSPTSAVDLVPTIAHINGIPVPDWAEGQVLPTFDGEEDLDRSIYSMDAKENSAFRPLSRFSLSLLKNRKRLTCYQFEGEPQFELYDLDEDPEEMKDLFPSQPSFSIPMKDELLRKLSEVNKPFDS